MASDGIPVNIPVTRLVHGSRARTSDSVITTSGKTLPPGGEVVPDPASPQVVRAPEEAFRTTEKALRPPEKPARTAEVAVRPAAKPDAAALVAQLNRHASNSGRPDQFRLDSTSGRKMIQQTNPDTDEVIAEYPESEFPALAQGLSGAGLLLNIKA